MIDIKLLRSQPDIFKQSVKRRGLSVDIEEIIKIDNQLQNQQKTVEELKSKLNIENKPDAETLKSLQTIKQQLESENDKLKELKKSFLDSVSAVPNLLADNTPDGGEENNRVEKSWGETKFDFDPKDHLQLNEINDLFDFAAGAKVAGNKFYFLKDKLVRLWQATELYAQQIVKNAGFELMSVPHLVNYDVAAGSGYMPKGEENQNYIDQTQKLVLIATAEIPLTGFHQDEVLDLSKPKLYAGISPSYRLEAGAYGKFSKGLYRTHQFEKLEMYVFCAPNQSNEWLQKILEIQQQICQNLKIPYQLVRIAAGDMSTPAFEKYDINYFSPAEKQYRELTSASNCTDFQSRNLNIRFRNSDGNLEFAHTLNGTAVVSSRMLIAILENYQTANGTIHLPAPLQQIYGSDIL